MKIGLFFGSFNPIHNGHLHIAKKSANLLDKIIFIVTPHNPFKNNLLDENDRLNMVKLAIEGNEKFEVSDIEFDLPRPSYTYITLEKLKDLYPNDELYLIMGSDVINSLHKWEGYDFIKQFPIIGYTRDNEQVSDNENVLATIASSLSISSTQIRNNLNAALDNMPAKVGDYIIRNNLYRKYTIQDEFVPYEQALALKKLGYKGICLGYYRSDSLKADKSLYEYITPHEFDEVKDSEYMDVVFAPLYQQAFNWIREVFNIHVNIYSSYDNDEQASEITGYAGHLWWEFKNDTPNSLEIPYGYSSEKNILVPKTYKDAELACLKKAIEIIEENI